MRTSVMQPDAAALRAAYAECERLAQAHYENFPVASWLVPARMRPHVAALYAFARTADDFADEGRRPDAERLRLLDDWQNRLHACVTECAPDDRVFLALGATIRDLPSAGVALRRSAQRVSSGYHDASLRHVGEPARLLPPIGESGRPARASHRRTRRRQARSLVRCAVHGAPADQLLAGPRSRLAERPALRAARGRRRRRGALAAISTIGA